MVTHRILKHCCVALCVLGSFLLAQAPLTLLPSTRLSGRKVITSRHTITLAPTGLPEQIVIKADRGEMPLSKRKANQPDLSPAELKAIGRGPQLRSPIRIEATIDGRTVIVEPATPVEPVLENAGVQTAAKLSADGFPIELSTRYTGEGAMSATMTYGEAGAEPDELALVIEPDGLIDTIVPGKPVDDTVRAYRAAEFALPLHAGTGWQNIPPPDVGEAASPPREVPGVVPHLWLGNGDRGFTWLCEGKDGWGVDEELPTMTIVRDDNGLVSWRILFVNTPMTLDGPRTVRFRLLSHPVAAKPANHRRISWLAWPHGTAGGMSFALSAVPPKQALPLLRADSATVWEGAVQIAVLNGPAGGDAISAQQNLADTYPISLFRYLAGTHTGSTMRLRSNACDLCRAGMSPATDRMVIARALLHDIGLDAGRLAHMKLTATVAKVLHDFGYFEEDGMTEFIPYWRSSSAARFGEEFSAEDPFATTLTDPLARVHMSLYRRPGRAGKGTRTLFVVVNEGDKPVRERFYVFAPNLLFGRGGNAVSAEALMGRWDFSGIPDESDWRKDRLTRQIRSHAGDAGKDKTVLWDVEDDGFVVRQVRKHDLEVYGPLFIPAHSFRLLVGEGE